MGDVDSGSSLGYPQARRSRVSNHLHCPKIPFPVTHPHVVPNLCAICSVEYKRIILLFTQLFSIQLHVFWSHTIALCEKQTRIKASILYKQQYQMALEDLRYITIQKFVVSKILNVLCLTEVSYAH